MAVKPTVSGVAQKWQFRLRIEGFDAALFTKCDMPSCEIEKMSFSSAGSIHDQNFAGRVKFNDITAEKGLVVDGVDLSVWKWLKQAANAETNELGKASSYKKTVELERLDRRGEVLERWILNGAWCQKVEGDGFEAGSSDALIEKMTIVYDYAQKS